jgi:steroid delta-isomerase-like uncharacterized protein
MGSPDTAPDSALRATREALVARHVEAELQGDATGVVATFKVPRYDLVASGDLLEGAEAVARRVDELAAAMPGVALEIIALHHADEAVIVETRTRGIHRAHLLGVPPTGRRYETRGVAIFRFDGADLIEEVVYWDRQGLIEQLRQEG